MLSKFIRLCKYGCAQSKEVWNDVDHFYHPRSPPQFIQGRCPLFINEAFNSARFVYISSLVIGSAVTYWGAKKIYNYQERSWFGLIAFPIFTGLMLFQLSLIGRKFGTIIVQIDLLPCGRQVSVSYPNFFGMVNQTNYDIAKISRPKDVDQTIYAMSMVFPVIFDKQLYYIQRQQGFITNKELLPAVMNGKYIFIQ